MLLPARLDTGALPQNPACCRQTFWAGRKDAGEPRSLKSQDVPDSAQHSMAAAVEPHPHCGELLVKGIKQFGLGI